MRPRCARRSRSPRGQRSIEVAASALARTAGRAVASSSLDRQARTSRVSPSDRWKAGSYSSSAARRSYRHGPDRRGLQLRKGSARAPFTRRARDPDPRVPFVHRLARVGARERERRIRSEHLAIAIKCSAFTAHGDGRAPCSRRAPLLGLARLVTDLRGARLRFVAADCARASNTSSEARLPDLDVIADRQPRRPPVLKPTSASWIGASVPVTGMLACPTPSFRVVTVQRPRCARPRASLAEVENQAASRLADFDRLAQRLDASPYSRDARPRSSEAQRRIREGATPYATHRDRRDLQAPRRSQVSRPPVGSISSLPRRSHPQAAQPRDRSARSASSRTTSSPRLDRPARRRRRGEHQDGARRARGHPLRRSLLDALVLSPRPSSLRLRDLISRPRPLRRIHREISGPRARRGRCQRSSPDPSLVVATELDLLEGSAR